MTASSETFAREASPGLLKSEPQGLRRSPRLQENGYYTPDGRPAISYKEKLYRVFRKIRRFNCRKSSSETLVALTYSEAPEAAAGSSVAPAENQSVPVKVAPAKTMKIFWLLFLLSAMSIIGARWFICSTQYETLPNYAQRSEGAMILRSYSSKTYAPGGFFERLRNLLRPRHLSVIMPRSPLVPGLCWPFPGCQGHLHVELAEPVHIHYVSLSHITASQSPTGATSAPKTFSVYGMNTLNGEETLLGQFQYENGPELQTFQTLAHTDTAFKHVRINVETNWGNTEYTCLYNFGVYGRPVQQEAASETPPPP